MIKDTARRRSFVTGLVSAPYELWAVLFILVPLAFVAYYAFTDNDFRFTTDNITRFFTATSPVVNADGTLGLHGKQLWGDYALPSKATRFFACSWRLL